MHIHILGICGTFMAGIAIIAKQHGHQVTGQDTNVYPPMSTQLEEQGITLIQADNIDALTPRPDIVVIGNALSRGNPVVEYILENNIPYTSGPQWLSEHVLRDRWVLAVAGTHGKTTTSSMLAWILEYANLEPGFLIGGVPENFGVSARMGNNPFFVIEADEYDSAFFDKRSKFVHYHPRTLVMNNLEFDHADIFDDLAAIQKQCHHLVRTVPGNGLIITPEADTNLDDTLKLGCWTPRQSFSADASQTATIVAKLIKADGSCFEVIEVNNTLGQVQWPLLGKHNVHNALAAITAARHAGVPVSVAIEALAEFENVKRRLEIKGVVNNITVYDDFAHHPTAIATTLEGLRANVGDERIIAIVDFASQTMRQGFHKDTIGNAIKLADEAIFAKPQDAAWEIEDAVKIMSTPTTIYNSVTDIVAAMSQQAKPGDHILVMSNKGFDGIHQKLLAAL